MQRPRTATRKLARPSNQPHIDDVGETVTVVERDRRCDRLSGWVRNVTKCLAVAGAIVTCMSMLVACSDGQRESIETGGILVVPSLDAGWVGWCVVAVGSPRIGGCPPGGSRLPIIAEDWHSGRPPTGAKTEGYVITTSKIISVAVGSGALFGLTHIPGLPDGVHGVSVEIRGVSLLEERNTMPHFTLFDVSGRRIDRPAADQPNTLLGEEIPVETVAHPAHPKSGACRIYVRSVSGVKAEGGSVVRSPTAHTGLLGRGFLTCASTSYDVDGWPLLASVLLDAGRPGAEPPELPRAKELKGYPGIFEAPSPEGAEPESELVARRVRGAWLVVSRAKLQQRLKLLKDLNAAVY
jgi:hypothetical protein